MSTWQSKTLGELFPSTQSAADAIAASANAALSKFNSVLSQLGSKADALSQLSGENSDLLSALEASGFYVLELSPGAGGVLPRIQSTGGDTPPVDGYSAGLVIVASAADLATVAARYGKLTQVLTAPIEVPGG